MRRPADAMTIPDIIRLLDGAAGGRIAAGNAVWEAWFDAMKRGRAFVSSGPLLEMAVGSAMPGDTVSLPANGVWAQKLVAA